VLRVSKKEETEVETIDTQRDIGIVKRWIAHKGFGFLALRGSLPNSPEIFVHHTAIMTKNRDGAIVPYRGFKQLIEGQEVEFDLSQCHRGFEALRVVAITGEPR
jgi:cold shock CspA family protein